MDWAPEEFANVKILVATPNFTNNFSGEVHVNHIECAVAWSKWGIPFNWLIVGRTFVHFARTQACQVAMLGNFSHILWLDDDAVISPELLPRYLRHDKDVVITPYFMRRPPHECGVLKSTTGNFHDHASYRNLDVADLHQGLIEVDGGGTHAMLVKTAVLQKPGDNASEDAVDPRLRTFIDSLDNAARQIIDHHVGTLPDERLSLEQEDTEGIKPYFFMPKAGTEDMLFCYRLKRKGVKIWCDTDATSGHIGFAPVITEDFRARMKEIGAQSAPQTPSGVQVVKITPRGITAGEDDQHGVTAGRIEAIDMSRSASMT